MDLQTRLIFFATIWASEFKDQGDKKTPQFVDKLLIRRIQPSHSQSGYGKKFWRKNVERPGCVALRPTMNESIQRK